MAAERTCPRAARPALPALVVLLVLPVAQAQESGCAPPGMNGQCNELGTIMMEFQHDIDGQVVEHTAEIVVQRTYQDGPNPVRHFMFSVRNSSTERGPSPVTVELVGFATARGPILVTRTDAPGPHELNLWVDVLDMPVNEPIQLTTRVGSTERGAFRLEVLVMPFDRGYEPAKDSQGSDASLFGFTLLAVNGPTGGAGGGVVPGAGFADGTLGKRLPDAGAAGALSALGLALLALRGRGGPGSRGPPRLFRRR